MANNHPSMPANVQAEAAILSHILMSPKCMAEVAGSLAKDHFWNDSHATIYGAMLALHEHGRLCTVFNVEAELERLCTDTRAPEYNLTRVFGDNIEYMTPLDDHVQKVKFAATCRRMIPKLQELYQEAFRQEESVVQHLEELAYQMALGTDTKSVQHLGAVLTRYMDDLDQRRESYVEGRVSGMPTGFTELDRMLGGLRRSRLYTLAALTGYGKTAIALNIAVSMATHAKHVLFFSAEMEDEELAERLLSIVAEVPSEFLQDGNVDDEQYRHVQWARERLSACRFEIDDSTHLLSEMYSKARKIQASDPLDLVVVDYLQLLDFYAEGRAKNESRWEEVGKISRELKRMARELDVPVLALAQMSRASEKRSDDRPLLSDLGESSGIEKNSDVVIFLYVSPVERESRQRSDPYEISVIVEKNRQRRMGTVPLRYRPRLTRFEDRESLHISQEVSRPYAD